MTTRQLLIDELERAISHGTAAQRVETLWQVTDLFVSGSVQYSEDHVAVFDDVIGRLAAEIEAAARAKLAKRLAPISNAPPAVVRVLASDEEIAVAGPLLAQSERLDEADLVESARTQGQQHLLAISRRETLSEAVTDVLVERGDRQVVHSTAENPGAKFSDTGFSLLVERSEGDDQLATRVGARADIPRHHFLKLVATASEAVRIRLKATKPQAIREIQQVVAEAATEIQARTGARSRDYVSARALVESLHASGRLAESEVAKFAGAGRFEETTVALAKFCDLPIAVVERAMVQERAVLALILARSIGLSWATTKLILQLRAGQRGISAHELEQCLSNFERLKPETAQQVVRFQRLREIANTTGVD